MSTTTINDPCVAFITLTPPSSTLAGNKRKLVPSGGHENSNSMANDEDDDEDFESGEPDNKMQVETSSTIVIDRPRPSRLDHNASFTPDISPIRKTAAMPIKPSLDMVTQILQQILADLNFCLDEAESTSPLSSSSPATLSPSVQRSNETIDLILRLLSPQLSDWRKGFGRVAIAAAQMEVLGNGGVNVILPSYDKDRQASLNGTEMSALFRVVHGMQEHEELVGLWGDGLSRAISLLSSVPARYKVHHGRQHFSEMLVWKMLNLICTEIVMLVFEVSDGVKNQVRGLLL
ncbi:hypothetical protein HDU76_007225 [Blyttiomyces sp. JEL0837]|nr:hypothetical protein HDU76_007225 [Blyttiomyces sp. JEL0837]